MFQHISFAQWNSEMISAVQNPVVLERPQSHARHAHGYGLKHDPLKMRQI